MAERERAFVTQRNRSSNLESFVENVANKQRNIVLPDPLVNSRNVDRF